MRGRCKKILELGKRLARNKYAFEWEIEDAVSEFRKTSYKSTRNLGKALAIERKLRSDLGRFLSPTARIVAVRLYKNNELRGEFHLDNTI